MSFGAPNRHSVNASHSGFPFPQLVDLIRLDNFCTWAEANNLSINVKKSKLMVVEAVRELKK